ncbi:hypothetical protein HKX42_03820 [Salinisphaera sp. USBA-960]|nr:hypothetical protein [Salifodinibacter halophilus]NNC26005.1 hypothetical protein [Salifodinibacter halophilus]
MTDTTTRQPQTYVTRFTGRVAQCTGCGEVFSSTTTFDAHRAWRTGRRVCLDPADCGLVIGQRSTGTFWKGRPDARLARLIQRAA